jgi:hypothetical protein
MGVAVEGIMRPRGRRSARASEARHVAIWVLSSSVDRLGVPELEDLFCTTERTIENAWREVLQTPRLLATAQRLIEGHKDELMTLPAVRDVDGE